MLTEFYKNTHGYRFESVGELLDDVQQVSKARVDDEARLDVTQSSWIGREFETWGDVYQAATETWASGLSVVDRMLADLDDVSLPRPTNRRRRTRFSEDNGDELDYDRMRSGQPYWRTSRRQNARGPSTVTILVDVGANCRVSHRDILWRGAAAIALTKRLEEAGYRVELWSVHHSEGVWSDGTGHRFGGFHAVCLKRPGDPLDPATLIAAVSGWFFRTVMFRSACLGTLNVNPTLGQAKLPTDDDLDFVTHDAHRILIAGAFSYEDAVTKLRHSLSTFSQGRNQ